MLAAGVEAVRRDKPPAAPGGLVGQHPPRLPEALVADGAGGAAVAGQPGHVQVLDRDRLVRAGEHGRGLVQRVGALVRDPGVQPGRACRSGTGRFPRR